MHVRLRTNQTYGQKGFSSVEFETVEKALLYLENNPMREKLIILHSGIYYPDPVVIQSPIQIIGAGKIYLIYYISHFLFLFLLVLKKNSRENMEL